MVFLRFLFNLQCVSDEINVRCIKGPIMTFSIGADQPQGEEIQRTTNKIQNLS